MSSFIMPSFFAFLYNSVPGKKTKENIVEVAWEKDSALHGSYTTRLLVVLSNRAGSLGTLSTVIGKNMGNISNLKITSRARDFFNILVDIISYI